MCLVSGGVGAVGAPQAAAVMVVSAAVEGAAPSLHAVEPLVLS